MEFSRQEHWSELPLPSPGDLPNSGIKPRLHLSCLFLWQECSLPLVPPGKPMKLPNSIMTPPYPGAALEMAYTVCRECFSLNKSTSYLSICLSLNSFCNETLRTWDQVCDLSWRSWVQAPIWVTRFTFLVVNHDGELEWLWRLLWAGQVNQRTWSWSREPPKLYSLCPSLCSPDGW